MDVLPGLLALSRWLDEKGQAVKKNVRNPAGLFAAFEQEVQQGAAKDKSAWDASRSVMPEVRAQGVQEINARGQELGGLLGTFAGIGAKTADAVKLSKAKDMVKAGADPVQVWQQTGWTNQFPDGKWRFEISDKTAKVKPNPADFNEDRLISESVTHPDYFAAYPQLRDMTGTFDRQYKGESGIGSAGFLEDYPHISVTASANETKPITLHEMQHVVQGEEGFARGGSPKDFDASAAQRARDVLAWRNEVDSYIKRQWPTVKNPDYEQRLAAANEVRDEYYKLGAADWIPNPQVMDEAIKPTLNPGTKQRTALEQMVKEYGLDKRVTPKSEMDMYRSLAGEAEARLTQSRMNLTPAERSARPPWLEFNVPREQQIVRGLLGEDTGKAMSVAPTKFERAHAEAQRNAALPVEQGGLGLGPNNTAAERAKAMGFDTDAYHGKGGEEVLAEFDPERVIRSGYGVGLHSAKDPRLADVYANQWPSQQAVYPLKLKFDKKGTLQDWKDSQEAISDFANTKIMQGKGFDGLEYPHGGYWATVNGKLVGVNPPDDVAYASFKPENIRSRFAAFDPKKRNSRDLLASMGLLGLLGAGAYGSEQQ